MSISRNSFDPDKNYKRVNYHQDRDLLDSELNEQQDILTHDQRKISDTLLQEGAIISGLEVTITDSLATIAEGIVYIDGSLESVPGTTLTYDTDNNTGPHYVFVELLKYNIGKNQDVSLINPATGEATAEREKWEVTLKGMDTTEQPLPPQATERKVVPIYKVELDTGVVYPIVRYPAKLRLEDHRGTLPGNRITVSSITENQLALPAAEGRNSLLQNMAERTCDQSGSFVVNGLDSFVSRVDENHVEVVTNAGRAYIHGYRLDRDLPTTTIIPKSTAVQSVRGELKTFFPGNRRYTVDHTPMKESTHVEAFFEKTGTITRGSTPGGLDLLTPNPVVDILEVRQGGTTYEKGVDWKQTDNYVDWLSSGNEPASGSTYAVRWIYTKVLAKDVDYTDGGWFGQPNHPAPGTYYYFVTVVTPAEETVCDPNRVVSRHTAEGEINSITWNPAGIATGYRIYRAYDSNNPFDLELLAEVDGETTSYVDDGVDEILGGSPLFSGSINLEPYPLKIAPGNPHVINFGKMNIGESPLAGSNVSIDYDYYVGRQDVIFASRQGVQRIAGAPADDPKDPIVPYGTMGLCSIYCPPNSTEMELTDFELTRVPMDQLHRLSLDVERLKNDYELMAMRQALLVSESETIIGVYADNFASDAQSDLDHPEWNSRIDTVGRFVAPDRVVTPHLLEVDYENSNATFVGSMAMLPGNETVLLEQADWSEDRAINPKGAFGKPESSIWVSPNVGRSGLTTIDVVGFHFAPSASNVTISCDDQVVATDLSSDSVGRISGSFVIPEDVRPGDRVVEMSDGVHTARCKLKINDPKVIAYADQNEQNFWNHQRRSFRLAPLAQVFSFPDDRVMSGVGLHFTQKDESLPVTVQIRSVTKGLPSDGVLAEAVISPGEINVDDETKIVFNEPVWLHANDRHAVVIQTSSSKYRVQMATIGHVGQPGIITGQVPFSSLLLESVEAESWKPLDDSSLQMTIYGYEFQTVGEVRFKEISGIELSGLALDATIYLLEGNDTSWEYSKDRGSTWNALLPGKEENFSTTITEVIVRAGHIGFVNGKAPILSYRNVMLHGYSNQSQGLYITKEVRLFQDVGSTKVYTQMEVPIGTDVKWYASNDSGVTWKTVPIVITTEINQELTEYIGTAEFAGPRRKGVRYKAEMTGNSLIYPRIHTLCATFG